MPLKSFDISITEFVQSVAMLVRRVRQAGISNELSMTESMVVSRIDKDGPATTADLARAESMKPQSMGATVASLEHRGIVERKPHSTDGRQMLVHLTAKGTALRKSTREAKHSWIAQAFSQLDEGERRVLFEAGEIIRRVVEK